MVLNFNNSEDLVQELCRLRDQRVCIFGEKKPTVRSVTFKAPKSNYDLTSWRIWEQAFRLNVSNSKKCFDTISGHRITLPTNARGLFTGYDYESKRHRIVIRGYDKFFNIDEVPITTWDALSQHTKGPYELTVKENGCIIFIAALPDGQIIVSSKHSLGIVEGQSVSHANVGERWLEKHLQSVGRTKQELAHELLRRDMTAVAELCDDEFEEHILPYTGNSRGLYLHGLNRNCPQFITASSCEVAEFAEQWGFMKVSSFFMDSIHELKAFLENASKDGKWNNRAIEGFVIRCHSDHSSLEQQSSNDFFFKYKFPEPYGMFRQWREVTKMLISGKKPSYTKYKKVTAEYITFCDKKFKEDEDAKRLYMSNKGIISLRDEFLVLSKLDLMHLSVSNDNDCGKEFTLLVPIATIGCGKTTVAKILEKLFGWPVVQNDNLPSGKGGPKRFAKAIIEEFRNGHSVVFADRNNHISNMRSTLQTDILALIDGVRFVALPFKHTPEVPEFVQNRVLQRGDRHQSIKVSEGVDKVKAIMNTFYKQYKPFDPAGNKHDANYDDIIELDPLIGSLENARRIVNYFKKNIPELIPNDPSDDDYAAALNYAVNEYVPTYRKTFGNDSKKIKNKITAEGITDSSTCFKKAPRYFGVLLDRKTVESSLVQVLTIANLQWQEAFSRYTLQDSFHITMIHESQKPVNSQIWEQYLQHMHDENTTKMGNISFRITHLVWDDRVICFRVTMNENSVWYGKTCNPQLHITLGTSSSDVKAFESNFLLKKLRWQGDEVDSTDGNVRYLTVLPKLIIEGMLEPVY